jgi:hypothetical protein
LEFQDFLRFRKVEEVAPSKEGKERNRMTKLFITAENVKETPFVDKQLH